VIYLRGRFRVNIHNRNLGMMRGLPLGFGIRFPGVTSRIPDPDQLTHSGRILRGNSRISETVCGCRRTDSVGGRGCSFRVIC